MELCVLTLHILGKTESPFVNLSIGVRFSLTGCKIKHRISRLLYIVSFLDHCPLRRMWPWRLERWWIRRNTNYKHKITYLWYKALRSLDLVIVYRNGKNRLFVSGVRLLYTHQVIQFWACVVFSRKEKDIFGGTKELNESLSSSWTAVEVHVMSCQRICESHRRVRSAKADCPHLIQVLLVESPQLKKGTALLYGSFLILLLSILYSTLSFSVSGNTLLLSPLSDWWVDVDQSHL